MLLCWYKVLLLFVWHNNIILFEHYIFSLIASIVLLCFNHLFLYLFNIFFLFTGWYLAFLEELNWNLITWLIDWSRHFDLQVFSLWLNLKVDVFSGVRWGCSKSLFVLFTRWYSIWIRWPYSFRIIDIHAINISCLFPINFLGSNRLWW